MKSKDQIIKELVYSASGRFSACETKDDFVSQQRLYTALLTERIDDLLSDARDEYRNLGLHLSHCNFGEYAGTCKYDVANCPALTESWSWFGRALDARSHVD